MDVLNGDKTSTPTLAYINSLMIALISVISPGMCTWQFGGCVCFLFRSVLSVSFHCIF